MRQGLFKHCRNFQPSEPPSDGHPSQRRSTLRQLSFLFVSGGCLLSLTPALLAAETGEETTTQGVDLQSFHPSSTNGLLGLEAPVSLDAGGTFAGLSFNYAADLLSLKFENGAEPIQLVSSQAIAHLHGGYGLNDWLEVGGSIPLFLNNAGLDSISGENFSAQSAGDLNLYFRTALLPERRDAPGVAIQLPVTLPTGDEAHYAGEPGLTFSPQISVGQVASRVGWTAMVGYRVRTATTLSYEPYAVTLPIANELLYGAAADVEVQRGLRVAAGLEGRVGAYPAAGDNPLEGRFGLKLGLSSGVLLDAGAAFGISAGYGVPVWRAFAGVSYAYKTKGFWRPDGDSDGFTDDTDKCPAEAEDADGWLDGDGCPDPDNDSDGVADVQDKCPVEPETRNGVTDDDGCPEPDRDVDGRVDDLDRCPDRPEDLDNFEDEDGCPEEDNDGDSVVDGHDNCPGASEDKDGFQDEDGCPDPDNDNDQVQDLVDRCPTEAETMNGFEDDDGCPDKGHPEFASVEDKVAEKLAEQAATRAKSGRSDTAPGGDGDAEDESSTLPDATSDPLRSMTMDTDGDGLANGIDACPRKPETVNGYKDQDGCPENDADEDGVPDKIDKCPKKAETRNGIQDEDGCPEKDTDGDGIVDPVDQCPKKPETLNAYRDGDGCPDIVDESGPAEVHPEKHETKAAPVDNGGDPRADHDEDGIPDGKDLCPRKPEIFNGVEDGDGCPEKDSDGDGIIDALDKCPKKAEWVNGFKDDDGCPEWDTDRDGLFDALDKCPNAPETVNGIEDSDGCPELDSDQDGVLDVKDQCPDTRETANGFKDDDGCPDTAPPAGKSARSTDGKREGAAEKSPGASQGNANDAAKEAAKAAAVEAVKEAAQGAAHAPASAPAQGAQSSEKPASEKHGTETTEPSHGSESH